ncbi:hypothetical protein FRACA_310026 [Frankia canadensis]|uniref:Uncharacterized protein n=1 Tax=Frankia canadensis TaxID=1836972 RepID=A0A2I2KU94_9ACTN|nr:hypothetical protein FRACA_310026 [Frankia canadensis]SOU56524.1 hypothetical protein FRACA_310026 [Frankia canadensis]
MDAAPRSRFPGRCVRCRSGTGSGFQPRIRMPRPRREICCTIDKRFPPGVCLAMYGIVVATPVLTKMLPTDLRVSRPVVVAEKSGFAAT